MLSLDQFRALGARTGSGAVAPVIEMIATLLTVSLHMM
jgi:hypothetical protein